MFRIFMKPYLKKVEIHNYKTHRNTKILFTDGINSIVGPNGVGKSNILEAIVFALGERSLKSLRAASYGDIVYNNKKDVDVTVTLTLVDKDGNEHKFKRIYSPRRGEHKYRYNGRNVSRTSYIINLMKLGGKGFKYVYIQQGDIINKANATPKDIRAIVDDALGIRQYEDRKSDALKRLEEAEIKLRALEEKYSTIQRFIREYLKDMIDYHTYENLTALQKYIDSGLASIQKRKLISILNKKKEVREKLHSKLEKVTDKLNLIFDKEDKLNKIANKIETKLAEMETRRYRKIIREIEELRRERDKIKTEILETSIELKGMKRRIEEYREDIKNIRNEIVEDKNELKKLIKIKRNLESEYKRLKGEYDKLKERLDKIDIEFREKSREWINGLKETENRIIEKAEEIAENLYISRRRDEIENEIRRIDHRIKLVEESMKALDSRRKNIKEKINDVRKDAFELKQSIRQLKEKIIRMRREINDAERLLAKLDRLINKLEEEKRTINEYAVDSKVIYETAAEMGLKGVIGILNDILKGPSEIISLVKDANPRLWYSIIVRDRDTADKLLKIAKELKKKASVIILKNISYDNQKIPPNSIVKLIKYPKELTPLVYSKFKNIVVASAKDDIEKSLEEGYTVIDVANNYIIRHEEMLQVSKRRVYVPHNLKKVIEIRRRFYRMIEKRRREYINKTKELDTLQRNYNSLVNRLASLRNSIEFINIQIKYLKELYKGLKDKREKLIKELSRDTKTRKEIKIISDVDFDENISRLLEERIKIEEKTSILENELNEISSQLLDINNMIGNYQRLNQKRKEKISKYMEEIRKLDDLIKELKKDIIDRGKNLREIEKKIKSHSNELINIENEISNLREKLNRYRKKINLLITKERRLEEIRKKIEKRIIKIDYILRDLRRRVEELDNVIKDTGFENIKLFNYEIAKEVRSEIISELDNYREASRHAEERYYEHIENYKMFSLRRGELYKERDEILRFIREIDEEKERVFLEGFNKFKQRFQEMFREVFPGSKAYIELEDPEDLDSNILVYIEFKDKPRLPLSALSGGEKTAIILMLLLSIYSINEDTIFLLDEVDAHLDIRNLGSIGRVIKAQEKYSQVILVTLPGHDSMITIADHIIAVTYRNGVSRVFTMSRESLERMVRE